jgi:hypothetical protein
MSQRIRALFVTAALAGSLAACNAEPSFGPGARSDLPDVIDELSIVKNSIGMQWSKPIRPTEPPIIPANCAYAANVQSFVCPSQTVLGVTVSQSYTLLSARNDAQSAFDIKGTAAVRLRTTLHGRTSLNGSDLAVDGDETLTMSGLLSGTHTVDGTSALYLVGTLMAANGVGGLTATPINTSINATVSQLVLQTFPSAVSAVPYTMPLTGTIRVENRTSIGGQAQTLSTAVFPYDGTDRLVAVITRDGTTHTCEIALLGVSYVVCL